jgi:hypothetical protein
MTLWRRGACLPTAVRAGNAVATGLGIIYVSSMTVWTLSASLLVAGGSR